MSSDCRWRVSGSAVTGGASGINATVRNTAGNGANSLQFDAAVMIQRILSAMNYLYIGSLVVPVTSSLDLNQKVY